RARAEAVGLCAGPDAILCLDTGPDAGAGTASTVVDCSGPRPVVLRAGAIAAAELSRALDLENAAP
ncbi:MAG TPA: hypothetical protein VLC53_15235, partial [Myxococcota bacterium]|nr:hypothetical protein [Myxococcota bacterium]